jgi:hypothetical protein
MAGACVVTIGAQGVALKPLDECWAALGPSVQNRAIAHVNGRQDVR